MDSSLIDSYKLIWTSPICQQEVSQQPIKEVRPFKFYPVPSGVFEIDFLFYLFGEKLPIDFGSEVEFTMDMGINSKNSLPTLFESQDGEISINFSLD